MQKSHIEMLLEGIPSHCRLITVIDGHPATLAWLGLGDRTPDCSPGGRTFWSDRDDCRSLSSFWHLVSVFDQQSNVLSRLDSKNGPGLEPGQFLSPHRIAYDSKGDLYIGDVVDADWAQVFPDREKPHQPRRFQKLRRVSPSAP